MQLEKKDFLLEVHVVQGEEVESSFLQLSVSSCHEDPEAQPEVVREGLQEHPLLKFVLFCFAN